MKRTWIVALAICSAVFFTACNKSSKNIETVPNTTAENTVTETDAVSQEANFTQASRQAPGSEEEYKIMSGKITSMGDTMESMTLLSGDNEISINLKDVDIETTYALDSAEEVNVIYKGEISGKDVSNATFVMIVDGQEGLQVQQVTGKVREQGMSTFSIETEDKTNLGFLKNNCEGMSSGVLGDAVDASNGSGAKIKVTYVSVGFDTDKTNFPLKLEAVK